MYVPKRKPLFRKDTRKSNPYGVAGMLAIIIMLVMVLRSLNQGEITPMFLPTPTPTRTLDSFAEEGAVYFGAGDLDKAIEAYRQAVALDPNNPELRADLARIMVYSSTLLTIDEERIGRLQEALDMVNSAVEIQDENSPVHAVKAFVLDWLAGNQVTQAENEAMLTEAEQEAIYAIQLDNQNMLALAYYSEILVDQQKWIQAEQNMREAVSRSPDLMDVRRINGYVQESLGNYSQAISEYQEAVRINPNMTFIYLRSARTIAAYSNMKPRWIILPKRQTSMSSSACRIPFPISRLRQPIPRWESFSLLASTRKKGSVLIRITQMLMAGWELCIIAHVIMRERYQPSNARSRVATRKKAAKCFNVTRKQILM